MTEEIRILFLAADPVDIKHIRLDQEVREIDERINSAKQRDSFSLITKLAVRTRDLYQALLTHQPHIVHFGGHGSSTEGIFLEDSSGKRKAVSSESLAELFAILPDFIRIVVLNACYSAAQADSISKVIDYTVVMNDKIGDQSAILFSSTFYLALASSRSVQEAFDLGAHAIKFEGFVDNKVPKLLIKAGADASKSFLSSPPAEEPKANKVKSDMKQEMPRKREQPVYTGTVCFDNSPPTAHEMHIEGQRVINQEPNPVDSN